MDKPIDEERAKSAVEISRNVKPKLLNKIFKHQLLLMFIQYLISVMIFIIGICLYYFWGISNLMIGTIQINDIEIKDLRINIGTILVLVSIYMFMKITLDLNIKIHKGEEQK